MIALLFIGFLLTLLGGLGIFVSAKSAIHEIEGCILLLISAVLFSGLGIIQAIEKVERKMQERVSPPL